MAQLWFKFWAKEYLSDSKVRSLSYEQRGILQALWAFAWEEGSIPADANKLGNMLGIPSKAMRTHYEWICLFFAPSDADASKMVSPRLEMERMEADSRGAKARESAMQRWSKRNANASPNAMQTDMPTECDRPCVSDASQSTELSTSTPLTPLAGGTASEGKPKKPRKPRFQAEDITPENAEYLRKVYDRAPTEHPVTEAPVHKGPFAEAARNFQAIADSGEATPRELMAVGTVYYRAEMLGEAWVEAVNRVWDSRPRAMMQVSTLYGPQKRAYRQLLPLARKLIEFRDAEAAKQVENVVPLEAAS